MSTGKQQKVNSATPDHLSAYTGYNRMWCKAALPSSTSVNSSRLGKKPMGFPGMEMQIAGGGSVEMMIANGATILAHTNTFTAPSGTSSVLTGYKSFTTRKTIADRGDISTFQVVVRRLTGTLYFARDDTFAGVDIRYDNTSSDSTALSGLGDLYTDATLTGYYYYQTAPSKPQAFTVAAVDGSPGSALASWSAPSETGGDAITNYTLQWSLDATFATGTTDVPCGNPGTGTFQVDGLPTTGETIYFQLSAENSLTTIYSDGSEWSDPASIALTVPGPKYWDGAAWGNKPLKYWDGAAETQKPLKVWDGAAWRQGA